MDDRLGNRYRMASVSASQSEVRFGNPMNHQIGDLQSAGVDSRRPYPAQTSSAFVQDRGSSMAGPQAPAKLGFGYIFGKRSLDIAGALLLAAAFLPLMLLVAIALQRQAGAVIIGHKRIGKNGKEFKAYKFRTMMPDADRALRELQTHHPEMYQRWMQERDLRSDPRMTNLGKFLRRTYLDQLPMLWNVLNGEMSLVGPKPIGREEFRNFGSAARYYVSQKPGLTGLWQVTGRSSRDFRSRIATDRRYALTASLWVDLIVLFKTISPILSVRRAVTVEADDDALSPSDSEAGYDSDCIGVNQSDVV